MTYLYDLLLAECLQVWLHQAHLVDAWAFDGEARVLALVRHVLAQAHRLPAGSHPDAPALLAALQGLGLQATRGPLPAVALKQELAKVLYAALRQSTAANGGPAAALQAFAFSPPPEFAPRPTAVDFATWT
ncbi:MAG: hypothetical protein ACRYFR_16210 [Janthinobacterium lividum]